MTAGTINKKRIFLNPVADLKSIGIPITLDGVALYMMDGKSSPSPSVNDFHLLGGKVRS